MSFNVSNNPFQGAYLFNYNYTPQSRKPAPQQDPTLLDPTMQDPTMQKQNTSGRATFQSYQDDQLRKRNALEQRKKSISQSQPQSMKDMLQQLSTQQQEVNRLKHQLDSTNDPALQQLLKEQYGAKSQNYSSLEAQVSLMFRGPGGGFVGSEGKIDHIGSFVTTS